MDVVIRTEREEERRIVEKMTKAAFWNVNYPGCDEHFVAHRLRLAASFVPELDLVALRGDRVVGNIMFTRAKVVEESGKEHEILTFGPVSVWPELQKQGIGGALIRHAMAKAAGMGFVGIAIYGNPDYYQRFGFVASKRFGISATDGMFLRALQAVELKPNGFGSISGKLVIDDAYFVDTGEFEAFDRDFPVMVKMVLPQHEVFATLCQEYI